MTGPLGAIFVTLTTLGLLAYVVGYPMWVAFTTPEDDLAATFPS